VYLEAARRGKSVTWQRFVLARVTLWFCPRFIRDPFYLARALATFE
jgi:hypothetical protein